MELRDHERSDSPASTGDRPRCAACRDVIGVYERLVHVFGGFVWHTSRAAEPGITAAPGMLYHLACYEGLSGQSSTPPSG
jgi:hypothetical protein